MIGIKVKLKVVMKLKFLYAMLVPSFLLISCARIETIGMKRHQFNANPSKIVWIQVPGLDEEHLAMVRFNIPVNAVTAFDKMNCVGKSWNYNYTELRPNSLKGTMSQLVGSKNIAGTCEDYQNRPIWKYLEEKGFVTGILEHGNDKGTSFDSALKCQSDFLSKSTLWSMSKADSGKELFHFQEKQEVKEGAIYYDKSCQNGPCFSSLEKNFSSIWDNLKKRQNQVFLLVRDFSYEKALKEKDVKKARQILLDLEKLVASIIGESNPREYLVVISSSAAQRLEFPNDGKDWFQYEKSGQRISYKRPALMSPVFSYGALSENFCGIYEESTVLQRFLWTPTETKLILEYLGL